MRTFIFSLFLIICLIDTTCGQVNSPWESPLMIANSPDGINFSKPVIFQDSSGVVSAIQWKADTLIAAFQWFRQPQGSASWDRVAVKFSYNRGIDWTVPVPVVINNFPLDFQRPFDPALLKLADGSVRLYFSSSHGMPVAGGDSIINTYSAISHDGIHYNFETAARVDHPTSRVIDPSVIYFKNMFHYLSPAGAPQDGAFHYISPDGIHFTAVPEILSDFNHNWTGNYMVADTGELRFYGCGVNIWYNPSSNGGIWKQYVPTNLVGGDPSVMKFSDNSYMAIFTGQKYSSVKTSAFNGIIHLIMNQDENSIMIETGPEDNFSFSLFSMNGILMYSGKVKKGASIDIRKLEPGIYILQLQSDGNKFIQKIVKSY